ncbi:MAG: hypothetical protein ABIN01_17100 [Ferruginibacter sp.]
MEISAENKCGSSSTVEKEIKNYIQPGTKATPYDNRVSVLEIIGTATRGGMENHIANFLKNLPVDKFKVTCICPCESLFTKSRVGKGISA